MKKLVMFSLLLVTLKTISFSQNMEINWQQCFGGSNEDHVYDIIPIDGGYFLVGSTESSNGDITYNHGSWDAWLLKIDSIGNILWEKTFGGSDGDGCGIIIPTTNNYFYLMCASGSSDGDISYDPYPGSNDIWIVKIDSSGTIMWDKMIGGGMIDAIESATLTQDGGVAVFGWTGSQNGDVSLNYGMYDMWLVKLNSDGEIMWDKSYGTDDFDYGQAMIATSDGGFLIGGSSTIGSGGNLTCEPYNYNAEAILLKLDSLGNIEWQNCYGGSGHDGIWGLLELENGYAFVGYGSSDDGDLTGSGWHGEGDIWVAKLDFYGNLIWQKCLGGSRSEYANILYQTNNNEFIIAGSTRSNDGDVTGNHSLSEYDYDIWLVKLSEEGELLSQQCFGGAGSELIQFGAVKKSDNNFVIAGYTDYGPSYDVACDPYGGFLDEDWWVFEIKDTTTGMQENFAGQNQINVYPNPASTELWLQLPENIPREQAQIELFNPIGKLLYKVQPASRFHRIETAHLPAGLYLMRLWDGERWRTEKVMIE